jgi:hypothetical protein
MTLEGALEPGQPVGHRVIVNVPTGSAHGPKINGTLVPPTGDCSSRWQMARFALMFGER